jgi:hypothetical protein
LAPGQSVTLELNPPSPPTNLITITANGGFNFSEPINDGMFYLVSVDTQPEGGTCGVTNEGGGFARKTVNVDVKCGGRVGGTVNGLGSGQVVVLRNGNGKASLKVTKNGDFAFPFSDSSMLGSPYQIDIQTRPADGSPCRVDNASGTIDGNVTDVMVTCGAAANDMGSPED